jgi:hypothetical protein
MNKPVFAESQFSGYNIRTLFDEKPKMGEPFFREHVI